MKTNQLVVNVPGNSAASASGGRNAAQFLSSSGEESQKINMPVMHVTSNPQF